MPIERRRFEGYHVVEQVAKRGSWAFMPFLDLMTGLNADIFYENNHVTPLPDVDYPNRYSAPFDKAVLIFNVEEEGIVVRFLQVTFWDDFVPN